jgi:hypothetical protein
MKARLQRGLLSGCALESDIMAMLETRQNPI